MAWSPIDGMMMNGSLPPNFITTFLIERQTRLEKA